METPEGVGSASVSYVQATPSRRPGASVPGLPCVAADAVQLEVRPGRARRAGGAHGSEVAVYGVLEIRAGRHARRLRNVAQGVVGEGLVVRAVEGFHQRVERGRCGRSETQAGSEHDHANKNRRPDQRHGIPFLENGWARGCTRDN